MKGLFSDPSMTYPLYIRQMIADQQHSPYANGGAIIGEAITEFFSEFSGGIEYDEYLKGM